MASKGGIYVIKYRQYFYQQYTDHDQHQKHQQGGIGQSAADLPIGSGTAVVIVSQRG